MQLTWRTQLRLKTRVISKETETKKDNCSLQDEYLADWTSPFVTKDIPRFEVVAITTVKSSSWPHTEVSLRISWLNGAIVIRCC